MGLAFEDRWIWDFWLVRAVADQHLFYLQASTNIGHPDKRHWNASIGHAVSRDLMRWETLPDALSPGPRGTWDAASTWTGSVIGREGRWFLLYTGTSGAEGGLVQRIGLAVSDDLVRWRRHERPVLEADPRWYETLDCRAWHDQAWRDPWVFMHPDDGQFHVLAADRNGSTYAGKLHQTTDGTIVFLAWHRRRPGGDFHGALSDPRPVEVGPDGALRVR